MRIIEPEFPQTRTIYDSNGPERWKFSRLLIFSLSVARVQVRVHVIRRQRGCEGREGGVKKIIIKMYRYKIVPRKKSKAQLRSHVASVPIICTFGEWQIDNNTRGYLRYFNK